MGRLLRERVFQNQEKDRAACDQKERHPERIEGLAGGA
jgi:hypothetical protein